MTKPLNKGIFHMATINVGDSTVDYEQIGTGPSRFASTLLAEMSVYDLVIEELAAGVGHAF